ncbi:MAG: Endonuclease 4 [Chlamydiia bacterium]|nr:Endonuclease 4 [Chlamydiia bacterium]MCH9615044.1 Endonuclease 4 [Chlamydiia bacterium]MCH9629905.1 Endonuclease 4 [Chlamydiia bacterium]
MQEPLVGAHVSISGGVSNAIERALNLGATTFQMFTANQKQWFGKPISDEELANWKDALQDSGLKKLMSHDSYLINLGSPKPDLLKKSRSAFKREIERCQMLGLTYMNFHPGTATDGTVEECLDTIVKSLMEVEALTNSGDVRLLIETTAGQGNTVGWQFEHLGYLIDQTKDKLPIGICIDTCHIFAAGYDIRTKKAWDETLKAFDKEIGLKHLYAFHLNDSLKEFGSRRDRHANLGEGEIGIECFEFLMTDARTKNLPKYLETPNGETRWVDEIALLKGMAK